MSTLGRLLTATLLLSLCLSAAKTVRAAKWAQNPCRFTTEPENTNGTSQQEPKHYNVKYDPKYFICLRCPGSKRTLVKLGEGWVTNGDHEDEACERLDCNGAVCDAGEDCVPPEELPKAVSSSCDLGKIGPGDSGEEDNNIGHSASQVPIIIGFAIGGIMLAVVVGGIFIGRTRGNSNSEASDVLTTPVSMSYSEWISNHSTGGRGSKGSNLRIQEAELEDGSGSGTVPVYNIVYNESELNGGHDSNANPVNPAVIEVDDDVMQTLGYDDNASEYGGQIYQHHFQDGHFAFPPSQNEERTTDNSVIGGRERGDRMSTTSSTMTPTSPESSWDANATPTFANHQQFSPNQQQENQQFSPNQQQNQQLGLEQQENQQLLNGQANWSDESDCEVSLLSSPPELIMTNNRRNLATVTHVFADVHRDDDVTDARDVTGIPTRPAPLPPAVSKANKRDRLSSSASGEYAIPYGAIKSSGPIC